MTKSSKNQKQLNHHVLSTKNWANNPNHYHEFIKNNTQVPLVCTWRFCVILRLVFQNIYWNWRENFLNSLKTLNFQVSLVINSSENSVFCDRNQTVKNNQLMSSISHVQLVASWNYFQYIRIWIDKQKFWNNRFSKVFADITYRKTLIPKRETTIWKTECFYWTKMKSFELEALGVKKNFDLIKKFGGTIFHDFFAEKPKKILWAKQMY